MARQQRTSAELLDAWGHVAYEVLMYTYLRSLDSMKRANETNTHRALYESLAVHIRNLIDLLCVPPSAAQGPRAQPDDIIAGDFTPWAPAWVGDLRTIRDDIVNKQVAHLTYKRVPGGTPWKWTRLWSDLDPLLEKFLRAVNGNHGIAVQHETFEAVAKNPGNLHLKSELVGVHHVDPAEGGGVVTIHRMIVDGPTATRQIATTSQIAGGTTAGGAVVINTEPPKK